MKAAFNIILIGLFLCQAFSTTFILINFELNKEEIAKTLCVKKEEPENCCQGSCHLKKQLQAEEKKEQTPARSIKQIKQIQLFYQGLSPLEFNSRPLSEMDFAPFQFSNTTPYTLSIFHPPC